MKRKLPSEPRAVRKGGYADLLGGLTRLLEEARRASVRSVNAVMTATYWEIGRRIVEFEQKGKKRADYGVALLKRLSSDLTDRFGRGFSERNLEQMRLFYLGWPISQTLSAESQSVAHPDENPPVGLILCFKGDEAVAHYALGDLSNKVFASCYKLQLPDPEVLKREIEAERRRLEARVWQGG